MAQQPIISLLHPTARVKPSEGFPRGWREACTAFFRACDNLQEVEYVLSVHHSRWHEFWQNAFRMRDASASKVVRIETDGGSCFLQFEGWGSVKVVKNSGRDCVVDQLNAAAAEATGKVFVGVQDDCFPPEHWDTRILGALPWDARFAEVRPALDSELILVCSTGAAPERDRELMIAGAMTRKRYERYGFILDPAFESMFSDNWQAFQARRDAAAGLCEIIERLDIQFDHRHPSLGKGVMDEIYELQNRGVAYQQGAATFHQKVTGAKVIVICLPGETFRNEWVATTFQLIQQLGNMGYITGPHYCYTSNVYCTRIELAKGALEFNPRADYVLWIDDDNLVTAQQVQMLVDDLEAHPELGGVTGWCWCDHNESEGKLAQTWRMSAGRQAWPDLTCLRFTADDFQNAFRNSPLITSDDLAPHAFWSGFPCVLMRRSALEKLTPQAFAPIMRDFVNYGFTGEDTAFFMNAHEKGVKFGLDIRVKVPHVKWRAIEPAFVPVVPGPQLVEMDADPRRSSAAD